MSDPREPSSQLTAELMTELGRAFDLATPCGERPLGEMLERRLRALSPGELPRWGGEGTVTEVSKRGSQALDFYYRPHLFPDMDPALRLGHQLQFNLLPRRLPSPSPVRVAAVLESYCHLSGDLLGWRREEAGLFLWILDVSGHGVRAGLAAAVLYFLINSIELDQPLSRFAREINDRFLAARNPADLRPLFATACWLRMERGGRFTYASSGHLPMLLRRASGEIEELGATGMPFGLLADQEWRERSAVLAPGDYLCLFTDGLVEATNPAGEEMGQERVARILRGVEGPALEPTRALFHAARQYRTTTLLEDDLTLLVVEPSADRF